LRAARAGDAVRIVLAHRAIAGSTYTTIISSTAVLAIFDIAVSSVLLGWAVSIGALPGLQVLGTLESFDFAWLFANPAAGNLLIVGTIAGVVVLIVWLRGHVEHFGERIGQAFVVLRPPTRYLRTVLPWQLADWSLRLTTIWCFLGAFDIQQSLRNVLLVQVTLSLATLAPATPGGIGTEQAFLTVVLRGAAPASVLLAFSVGMRLTLTLVNVVAALVAIALSLGTFSVRRVVGDARASQGAPIDSSTDEP